MKKRLFSILLTLCMVLALCPVTAFAEETGSVATEAELKEALGEGLTTITLRSNVTLTSTLDLSDKVITLDLNGHTLKGNIKLADSSAAPKSILTLIDSAGGGVLDGNIELTREENKYGNASYLYANGGTVTGKVSLNSYIAQIFCKSDTPTAMKGYVGNYGEIHGGILYGLFNASCVKEKTVTFVKDGKTYATEVVANGNKVAAPIQPSAPEGMKFTGWYTDEALTNPYEFGSTLSESITLYAGIQPITYTVEYIGSGDDPLCVDFKTHGKDLTLLGETFTMDGFVQTGWVDKETGAVYKLGGTYSTDADATLNPVFDEIITLTVPFTTTVKLGGNTAPGETTFDLAIVGANVSEENYADVVVSGSVTTNGAGDYEGTLTLTGPEGQLREMLCEGAFVQQVNAGEEGWTVDDTVYGLLWQDVAELATADTAERITVLILPVICEEGDDGVYYDLDWNADPLDEMTFTNTYTKNTVPPEDPTPPENPTNTGDNSNSAPWLALLAVSAAGMIGTGVYSKRRRASREK